jgi:FMN phosphatase YigB (HAD superfamily)
LTVVRLPEHIRGVSLDLGNTLYQLRAQEMSQINRHLHSFLERRLDTQLPYETLNRLYVEIRERQFAQNRPTLRENDFDERLYLMISHVHEPPHADLIGEASAAYSAGFVETLRLPEGMLEAVASLSRRYEGRVVVCSNFIVSKPISDLLLCDAILPLLKGVIVSCEIGFVKPHPLMFQAVKDGLGLDFSEIAHVGDDLDADIAGGKRAGMTTVFTTEFREPADAAAVAEAAPDFTIARLAQLLPSAAR